MARRGKGVMKGARPNTHMTQLEGVPDKAFALPGMAYFSGSGPAGTNCGNCALRKEGRQTICLKYLYLTGKVGPAVRSYYASCKYFEEKPK